MQFDFAMFFAYFGCLSFIGATFIVMAVWLDKKITIFDVISYVLLVMVGAFCVVGYISATKPMLNVAVTAKDAKSR